jgi:hypothetical protein
MDDYKVALGLLLAGWQLRRLYNRCRDDRRYHLSSRGRLQSNRNSSCGRSNKGRRWDNHTLSTSANTGYSREAFGVTGHANLANGARIEVGAAKLSIASGCKHGQESENRSCISTKHVDSLVLEIWLKK